MRELTQSVGRFSWALSLFGFKQLANLLMLEGARASPGEPDRSPAAALDSVSQAAESHLGDTFHEAFRTGNQLIQTLVDAMFGWGTGPTGGAPAAKSPGQVAGPRKVVQRAPPAR